MSADIKDEGLRISPFLVTYLLMLGGSLYFLFYIITGGSSPERAGQTLLYQAVWLGLYAFVIVKLATNADRAVALLIRRPAFIALALIGGLSLLANNGGLDSWIKFGMYLMTALGAAWLACDHQYSNDRVFETFYRVAIAVVILHVAVFPISRNIVWDTLDRPTLLGTMPYAGTFGHKNLAGSFFAISALVCLAKILGPASKGKVQAVGLMLTYVFMIVLAGATGALLSFFLASALVIAVYLVAERKFDLAMVYLVVLAAGALAIFILGLSGILALFGRNSELTGRVELWSVATLFFWQKPILGYGFANFFTSAGPASAFWSMLPSQNGYWSLDNSYLEIAVQLGGAGLFAFVLILGRAVATGVRLTIARDMVFKYGPLAIVSYILVASFFDSYLVIHNYIMCFLLFWFYFGLSTRRSTVASPLDVSLRRLRGRLSGRTKSHAYLSRSPTESG
jgi:exopolysaccharide production protein ExoQ